ncbi:DUF1330 domain-containing protein [Alphaproteobacteria bacterium GH1-50]|uniref:DUF1330 domain-containing protein n=1 Tax=Kangsaoukella pontilimi TaxID=2691042 RepID=A0A7C9MGM8_9RHOB|nr:DUF1330 domain-containing protein [Kangsaoukella pontilimi]MXQ08456.1 DUF1330 domain-containing protein [Kangsaoukella pontilimi]
MTVPCLQPTEAQAVALLSRGIEGPVVMLNLLRFRGVADYTATPLLAPDEPISGSAAFDLYVDATRPHLERSGGTILFSGAGGPFFIGPEAEQWDRAMLIRQASVQAFIGWATDEAYLDGIGHRTAALLDSRLLPLVPDGVTLASD